MGWSVVIIRINFPTVDERPVALLRLVCPAPSCLFGRADTFCPRFNMLNREAVGKIRVHVGNDVLEYKERCRACACLKHLIHEPCLGQTFAFSRYKGFVALGTLSICLTDIGKQMHLPSYMFFFIDLKTCYAHFQVDLCVSLMFNKLFIFFILPVLQHLFSPSVWNQSPVCSDWLAGLLCCDWSTEMCRKCPAPYNVLQ